MQGFVGSNRSTVIAYRPVLTNFYPGYDGANDQVDSISPVFPVAFQRVIPRYRLSTSETRDLGTGPGFIYSPGPVDPNQAWRPLQPESAARTDGNRQAPLESWKGRRLDVMA